MVIIITEKYLIVKNRLATSIMFWVLNHRVFYLKITTILALDEIDITTIKSTDAGVGFLVKVDGLSFYHAGNHANKQENDLNSHHLKIDYLAQSQKKLILHFF